VADIISVDKLPEVFISPSLERFEKASESYCAVSRMANASPRDAAKALHALDQVSLENKWTREFESCKTTIILSQYRHPSQKPGGHGRHCPDI
jgi:hypothetical protein